MMTSVINQRTRNTLKGYLMFLSDWGRKEKGGKVKSFDLFTRYQGTDYEIARSHKRIIVAPTLISRAQ